jgi:hypothetical protein
MFPVYGGKCLSHKADHNWVEKRNKHFADDEEVGMDIQKWLRQQSKLLCCWFRRHVKWWDKCINVGGGHVEKCFFFSVSNITCFAFYIHLWCVYLLSLTFSINICGQRANGGPPTSSLRRVWQPLTAGNWTLFVMPPERVQRKHWLTDSHAGNYPKRDSQVTALQCRWRQRLRPPTCVNWNLRASHLPEICCKGW